MFVKLIAILLKTTSSFRAKAKKRKSDQPTHPFSTPKFIHSVSVTNLVQSFPCCFGVRIPFGRQKAYTPITSDSKMKVQNRKFGLRACFYGSHYYS